MALIDGVPSSPPGPGTSTEEALKYYKAQYELLESELADFQTSSKELEAELEKDVEATEKRERQWKDKASNLQYEIEEWKTKYKQSKTEASNAQNTLQKEITQLREANRELNLRLRDTEVANDDYERKQRNTESSLEDLEQKYNQTIERGVLLEEEMRSGEQEREALRIEAQRLRDELSDLKIEADITKEKLQKATEQGPNRRERNLTLRPIAVSGSPRSELSPTTTTASSPTFDTPPAKSSLSDTPTPPSPPFSDKSAKISKPFATPGFPKSRQSLTVNGISSRPSTSGSTASKPTGHARGPSIAALSRIGPSSSFRQSLSRPANSQPRPSGLPHSASIVHLKNMQSKLAVLTERAHAAKSKLPAPVHTPPRSSPRSGSAPGHDMPSSVTVRSRKRTNGSTISGNDFLVEKAPVTPSVSKSRVSRISLNQVPPSPTRSEASMPRPKTSRPSLNQQAPSPKRGDMAAPPSRPASRANGLNASRSSFAPSHSRPGSRASVSGFPRAPLGNGNGTSFAPNASTDRVRPQSSLSSYGGLDGSMDENEKNGNDATVTRTPKRSTFGRGRTSDVGTAIPSPTKRTSIGGVSRLAQRQSIGLNAQDSGIGLGNVQENYDLSETF